MRKRIAKSVCLVIVLSFVLMFLVSCVRIKGNGVEIVKEVYSYVEKEPEAFSIIKAIFPESVDYWRPIIEQVLKDGGR